MGNIANIPSSAQMITQDFDDAYAKVIVIERGNMSEASRQRLAYQYTDENGDLVWLTKTLVKNIGGEVISVIVGDASTARPDWVSAGITE